MRPSYPRLLVTLLCAIVSTGPVIHMMQQANSFWPIAWAAPLVILALLALTHSSVNQPTKD